MFDIAAIKIGILYFYKRIFTTKRFSLITNIVIVVVAMWGIASLLVRSIN